MARELQVRCLGRLSLHCRDAPEAAATELPLPATLKAQSLLAYLVVNRQDSHTRDHLAGLFWGDRPERNARRSLATALWQIRRCLPGDDFILADATDVQFSPHSTFWLDAAEFEHLLRTRAFPDHISALQQAVELYRGAFLDGFYDDWVLSERYRLENLYCDALARLMAAQEALGAHAAVLAVALRLLDQDPLAEDAHRAAMAAYCRLGQRHAALAQYARCQQALETELGVAPMAETLALRQAIVEGRLASEPGLTAATLPVEPPYREPGRHPLDAGAQAPLVGREQELAFLADGWQAALRGGISLLLVSGEAGVGKTRLVGEFADQQRWQGVRVLQGRCYEFERLLPYQPIAEALKSLPPAAIDSVPAWARRQLVRLAPALFGQEPEAAGPASPQGGETQERLFEAASLFLAHLAAQQPLLLVLEDLHWAADSTLQLLHYLARALAGQPLLIVGALRTEAVSAAHPLATLGRRLERDGLARRLELACLSADAVASLIGRMSGEGEAARPLADRLYRETEGNPFYLIQTLKALFEQGAIRMEGGTWQADYAALGRAQLPLPAGVSEMIAARVGRLSEAAQDAVRVAAVAGREFDFDLLNAAWGKGEEATFAALDDLLRHRLIGEAAGGADYAFTHHKIQEAVVEGLPRHHRLYLHGQVGLAMERWLGAEAGARAGELAFHFEQARQVDGRLTDKALGYLQQAGRQAERQSANQEALGYYRRGLDMLHTLPETPEHLQQAIELQMALTVPTTVVHGYASPETRRVYDRASELCRKRGTRPRSLRFSWGSDGTTAWQAIWRRRWSSGDRSLPSRQASGDAAWLIEAYRSMGGPLFGQGRLREARAFFEKGAALYDPADHERHAYRFGHDPAAVCHGYLSLTLRLLGYPDQAASQGQRLRGLIPSFSHPTSLAYTHCFLAMSACLRRDAPGAGHDAEEAIRIGQSHGLPSWTALAGVLRGWALVEQGQEAEGLAQLREGVTAWRAIGFEHFAPFCLALQADACLKAHRLREAAAALAAARTIVQRGADLYWMAEVDRLQGELAESQGKDGGEAEAHFRRALATARGQEATMLELRAAMSLARLWRGQGESRGCAADTGRGLQPVR